MQVEFGRLRTFGKRLGFIAFSIPHRFAPSVTSLGDVVTVAVGFNPRRAGEQAVVGRDPPYYWLTAGVAQSRAFTSATLRRTSKEVAELAQTRPQVFSSIASLAGRPLLLAGGGLPLIIKGELLGGVGASGGTEEQDAECARAGLTAIGGE